MENSEKEKYRRDSRETIALLNGNKAFQSFISMEFKFNRGSKTEYNFVFGAFPNCDFVLNVKNINNKYFAITFDNIGRFIVRDCHVQIY